MKSMKVSTADATVTPRGPNQRSARIPATVAAPVWGGNAAGGGGVAATMFQRPGREVRSIRTAGMADGPGRGAARRAVADDAGHRSPDRAARLRHRLGVRPPPPGAPPHP